MQTQTIDVPLYSPGPPSSSDLQREKMNLTVGSIGSHSFVGAAASHNGTIRCEWKCKVCVYILTESSGLLLINSCRLLDWRLSVQRSAKGQTPAKKKEDKNHLFWPGWSVFYAFWQCTDATWPVLCNWNKYQERLCVGVYEYIYIHTLYICICIYTQAMGFPQTTECCWHISCVSFGVKGWTWTTGCDYTSYAKGVHFQLVRARVRSILFRCGILVMVTLHLLTGPMTTYTYNIYIEILGVSVWMCLCQQKIKQTFTLYVEFGFFFSPQKSKKNEANDL